MSDRRSSLRYPVVLPALYWATAGHEFHAVTVDISAAGILLRSAVIPAVNSQLVCSIRNVGKIEAEVVRANACDFALRVIGQNPSPGSIARKLIEISQKQASSPETVRVARRIVPHRAAVDVMLNESSVVRAEIVNLSASGVALLIDVKFDVGQQIVVGRQRATVMRQIDGGIGAAFLKPLNPHVVNEDIEL